MLIEVRGTEFVNRGAHLMLLAALQQIRQRRPRARVAMRAFAAGCPYERRAELGLYQLVTIGRVARLSNLASRMVPEIVRCRLGLALEREIDLVLDAGGFAYSDQRGSKVTERAARAVVRWKRHGTAVVLLPQAFGPFLGSQIRRHFRVIVEHADLIYVRDQQSEEHVVSLVGMRPNLRRAPDFTSLLPGISSAQSQGIAGMYCIVPNCRMVDRTPSDIGAAYVRMMAQCAEILSRLGCSPFLLLHEGADDVVLAQKIVDRAAVPLRIVDNPDPLAVKGIIGNCGGMIGSRYHALVSALSQGVPALAVGWSHKYQGLFDDYGFSEGILSVKESERELQRKIAWICRVPGRQQVLCRIDRRAVMERDQVQLMWDEIFHRVAL